MLLETLVLMNGGFCEVVRLLRLAITLHVAKNAWRFMEVAEKMLEYVCDVFVFLLLLVLRWFYSELCQKHFQVPLDLMFLNQRIFCMPFFDSNPCCRVKAFYCSLRHLPKIIPMTVSHELVVTRYNSSLWGFGENLNKSQAELPGSAAANYFPGGSAKENGKLSHLTHFIYCFP